MTKRSVFFVLLFSVYCLPVSVAQLYTDEVQVVSGLNGNVGIGTATPGTWFNSNPVLQMHGVRPTLSMTPQSAGGLATIQFKGISTNSEFHINFVDGPSPYIFFHSYEAGGEIFRINGNGNIGIGISSPSQKLSVNGNASKASAGDWLANSDARLKTNISPLHSQETLQKMLRLQGITYEWSDDKTGLARPSGIQYGFTAQNIQEVFPSLVVEDDKGYLQSSYSTYDAMLVESIRALNEKIERLERENSELRMEVSSLRSADDDLRGSIEVILERLGGHHSTSTIKSEKE